ncbi:hypothetical protein ACIP1G_04700 [Pseudomonas sp. NPDC089392]
MNDGIPASTLNGQEQAAAINLDVAANEMLRSPTAPGYGSNARETFSV